MVEKNFPNKWPSKTGRNSYKVYIKSKLIRRHKEVHIILIKGTIHQEEITTDKLHVSSLSILNIINQILLDLK
jgi:hypothetical protein